MHEEKNIAGAQRDDNTLTVADLISSYETGIEELRVAVAGMTDEQLRSRPVAGKWSALEVVCHIADCEQFFADRMKLGPSGKREPVSSVRMEPPEWCPSSSLSPAHSTTVSFPGSFLLAAAATRSDLVAATTETHLNYPRSLCTSGLLLTVGLGRILPIVA
jgi:hypothetical protein